MENLLISPNKQNKTPLIDFKSDGTFLLEGRSTSEDSRDFYTPVVEWLAEFSKNPTPDITMTVKLEYFNTSSSIMILKLFKMLEKLNKSQGTNIIIEWYYEEDDEDIEEAGEDYSSIVKLPFKLIVIYE